jgi:hypothetical protein
MPPLITVDDGLFDGDTPIPVSKNPPLLESVFAQQDNASLQRPKLGDFYVEIGLLVLLLLYALLYQWGKSKNEAIAKKWYLWWCV